MKVFGVEYELPSTLAIGDSFFVPCLNSPVTVAAVKRNYSTLGYTFRSLTRIEAGVAGVRIWRVG